MVMIVEKSSYNFDGLKIAKFSNVRDYKSRTGIKMVKTSAASLIFERK